MKYYPIHLNINGKKCVVIGGGKVAERKIMSLLNCGAKMMVVSPKITKNIRRLADKSEISFICRKYRAGDLKDTFLAVVATDDSEINKEVAKEAKKRKVLVNVADGPELCDFIMPSVIRRGDLVIAISTSGRYPAFAKKLRIMLEDIVGKEYGAELERLARIRDRLKSMRLSLVARNGRKNIHN